MFQNLFNTNKRFQNKKQFSALNFWNVFFGCISQYILQVLRNHFLENEWIPEYEDINLATIKVLTYSTGARNNKIFVIV